MKKNQNHILKMGFSIICIQIMCMNVPINFIDNFTSKDGTYLQINKEGDSKSDSGQNFPKNENESMEDNESFSIKIFTCSSKELIVFNQNNLNFLLYNIKNKIQFHPEFSTPPPKHLIA
jgi:hypothetical protein